MRVVEAAQPRIRTRVELKAPNESERLCAALHRERWQFIN